jgi:hypothetical protein
VIAGGQPDLNGGRCAKITVPIAPTKLRAGKTYWVEEIAAPSGYQEKSAAKWLFNPKGPNNGIAQYQVCYFNVRNPYCNDSTWYPVSGDYEPYAMVK